MTPGTGRTGIAILVAAVLLLGAAPAAGAATFTINTTTDAHDADFGGTFDGTCDTGTGDCSLRAAIEEANANPGADSIESDPAIVGCLPANVVPCTITIHTATLGPLPQLSDVVTIDGCSSDLNHAGPCVGLELDTPGTSAALDVGSGASTGIGSGQFSSIGGLAIGNANRGIDYAAGGQALSIVNNWIGLSLDGTTGAPNGTGVLLRGDGALLGGTAGASGTAPASRNVFANNLVAGIRILGDADDNEILGNYIGTLADGSTPAGNPDGIEVVAPDPSATRPDGTVIGTSLAGSTSTTCDGGCNVIAASSGAGIDLNGDPPGQAELPAGATTIDANFIGLSAAGARTDLLGNGTGIRVGGADDVTIGSPIDDSVKRNYIADGPGGTGVSLGTGKNLRLVYNRIGLDPSGSLSSAGGGVGVSVDGPSASSDGAVVSGNRFASDPTGVPLRLDGPNSTVTGNTFGIAGIAGSGGANAILLTAGAQDNRIGDQAAAANVIGDAVGAALRIEGGDNNIVRRNLIGTDGGGAQRASGGPGVQLLDSGADPADGNTIGATLGTDAVPEENVISNSGTDAIQIAGTGDGDVIGRNRGSANGSGSSDLFIDLMGIDGPGNPGGPNGAVNVPVISSATTASAAGNAGAAQLGALVRVFAAGTGETRGRISSFVGQTTASATTGAWSLDYSAAPLAAGTQLLATQTPPGSGTSELSDPVAAADITPPVADLESRHRQHPLAEGGLRASAMCDEPCNASANATVTLAHTIYTFRRGRVAVPADLRRKIFMAAGFKLRKALARVLPRRHPLATVTITVRDAAGNLTSAVRKVRLLP